MKFELKCEVCGTTQNLMGCDYPICESCRAKADADRAARRRAPRSIPVTCVSCGDSSFALDAQGRCPECAELGA